MNSPRQQVAKMLLEISGEVTPERMETEPKQKHPVVDVTSERSKVRCCKEQYCIGTWNVRSINQGKLKVVKQEMARVNVDILGISELKCTGWVNLTLLLRARITQKKWSSHHSQHQSPKCSTWMQSQKQNDLFVSKGNHSYHSNPSLCPKQQH